MSINLLKLEAFVFESNRIEGISGVRADEIEASRAFLLLPAVLVSDLCSLVRVVQPNAHLRERVGSNVFVGDHTPPLGGPGIRKSLIRLLEEDRHPWKIHQAYETLHPFTDGNGRSGRMLWAWQMLHEGRWPGIDLGFLHAFYYQTLEIGA